MARFCTLCSSSAGNAVYVGTAHYGILIDAGVSCRRLKNAMRDLAIDPDSIKAVFVTHEHTDHVSGLRVLAGSLGVPVYATGGTLAGLNNMGCLDGGFPTEKLTAAGVAVGDMLIRPFRTSHDAKEPCGYRIELPDRTVGVATDTGVVTDAMMKGLVGCDLVLLESNYDDGMLTAGYYPPQLKARIRSPLGHMSNDLCADTACRLVELGVSYVVLGHLSEHNNTPRLAYACTHSALKRMGAADGSDFELSVAPVGPMERIMRF